MFKSKNFDFRELTIRKGLERLLPNLTSDEETLVFGILGYTINQNKGLEIRDIGSLYIDIENNFKVAEENSEEFNRRKYISLGNEFYSRLSKSIKQYSLGTFPNKRKVAKFRTKEFKLLTEMNREANDQRE